MSVLKLKGGINWNPTPIETKWECTRCACTNMSSDEVSHCTFQGNQEEPPEYEYRCPECRADVEEMPVFWCRTCEDERVENDNDQCEVCHKEEQS